MMIMNMAHWQVSSGWQKKLGHMDHGGTHDGGDDAIDDDDDDDKEEEDIDCDDYDDAMGSETRQGHTDHDETHRKDYQIRPRHGALAQNHGDDHDNIDTDANEGHDDDHDDI